jgi:hypothetical protein
MSYECETCIREFDSWDAVRQHMNALNHWDDEDHTCDTCDKTFASEKAADQHMTALGHWFTDKCDTCNKRFVDRDAAEQHMDALDHWGEDEDEDEFECDRCDRTFTSWDACSQHMTALDHWYTDKCDTCNRRFVNRQAAEQHMDAVEHRSLPYCTSCERYLQNPSDLFQHMSSPIHMRADPIYIASPPPIRSAPVSRPAPVRVPVPTAPFPPAPVSVPAPPVAVQSSTLPATNPYRAPRLDPVIITAPTRPLIATPPLTPTPAVIASEPASGLPSNTQLVKPCTTCIPFDAFVETERGYSTESHYQSNTFMRPHQAFSFEELRLSDYKAGCKPGNGSIGAAVRTTYRDQSTQVDISHPPASSVYFSATSSPTAAPDLNVTDTGNRITESSVTTVTHTPKDLTALTANEIANFHLIHEANCEARRLVTRDDKAAGWVEHGTGPVRILQDKETARLHILMLVDMSGMIGMNFSVPLDTTSCFLRKPKIVQMNVPDEDNEIKSHFCMFEDEAKAKQFLDILLDAITEVRDSTNDISTFSLSEIKCQQTEPVVRPRVLSCPFCYVGFNAVWEVAEHLESSLCQQRPGLNCGSIHRRQCQQDPNGIMTVHNSAGAVGGSITETRLYRCPNNAGGCEGKLMSSFAELLAHFENESCGFIKREDLWKDIGECKNLWEDVYDC